MEVTATQLRAEGFEVRGQDAARLFPIVHHHVNALGGYFSQFPEPPGGMRSSHGTGGA
ncbi:MULTISPECIES: transposase [Streptomyces violaceusniger group]|uniref:Tn3 transposase DDE domain-containing protein n=1 Tax=Streptomyces rhizosphaericus TaxID=114699 RepID=A0ABN1RIL4_9ACTN|nr:MULTISPECIES: transposase [Streptomyces violaceusniger group]